MQDPTLLVLALLKTSVVGKGLNESFVGICPDLKNPQVAVYATQCTNRKCEVPVTQASPQSMSKINFKLINGKFAPGALVNPQVEFDEKSLRLKCVYENFTLQSERRYGVCEKSPTQPSEFKCQL
jgi:hypothetical protein